MTEPQDETLENQTGQTVQPDPPSTASNPQVQQGPLEEEENQILVGDEPVPPQFESPYFPNGVYEDARALEEKEASYDPFTAQGGREDDLEIVPKRKIRVIFGAIILVLIAAVIFALVTGRLVFPF